MIRPAESRGVPIEKMDDFFAARLDGYDEHMLNDVPGCREGYVRMARAVPGGVRDLLDLGCGTGLELDEIFRLYPDIRVTGIDLTQAMLDRLREKHPGRNLTLINGSYFDYDFGIGRYDAAVSFQTLHHFSHEDKIRLYTRIFHALKSGGRYVECDYMVTDRAEEDFYYAENRRIRSEQGISDGEYYHYDTPCTVRNQTDMLKKAGFKRVEKLWRQENTTLLAADK